MTKEEKYLTSPTINFHLRTTDNHGVPTSLSVFLTSGMVSSNQPLVYRVENTYGVNNKTRKGRKFFDNTNNIDTPLDNDSSNKSMYITLMTVTFSSYLAAFSWEYPNSSC